MVVSDKYCELWEVIEDAKSGVKIHVMLCGARNDEGVWRLVSVPIMGVSFPWGDGRMKERIDGASPELVKVVHEWASKQRFGDRWEAAREDYRRRGA